MNFKNITRIVILLMAVMLFSCNDDFLETVDPNSVGAEQYWQTTDEFNSGLAATYAALQFNNVCGGRANVSDRARTDISRSFYFYTHWVFTTFTWSGTETEIGDRWKELYVGIFRANQVIDNAAKVTPEMNINPFDLAAIEGQARFLRGLLYFWVVNSYGGAVVHTSVPEDDEIQGKFQDREVVIEDVIIPDLQRAIRLLPSEWPDVDLGRATSGAARGILGKVYLFEEQFDEAIGQFDTIINSGIYSYTLTESIGENFTLEGEHNSESMFEVGFNDLIAPGVPYNEQEALPNNGHQSGQATNKASYACPQSLGGLRAIVPTFWAAELFMKDSLNVNTTEDTTRRWSDRAYWSIAFPNQDGDYYLQPVLEGPDWFLGGAENAYWKKFTNWYSSEEEESWTSTMRSGINERILRYADIKLMYAEALLRKANPSNEDFIEALGHVEDIRERAGVLTLTDYTDIAGSQYIPQLHLRGPLPYTSPWVVLNSQSLLTHIQMVERPLEFAFEGNNIRWHDLRRWDKIGEALNMVASVDYKEDWMIYWVRSESLVRPSDTYNETYDSYDLHQFIDDNQQHQAQNYIPDRHNYFPIPLDEINANDNLQ